jgi:deoxyribodipyrimidine photolyase-related protein
MASGILIVKTEKKKIINQPSICFNNDVSEILNEVKKTNKTIGSVDAENFVWPINREQSWFCWTFRKECLHLFGSYQML